LLRRNFWFCSIDDPSAFGALDAIGAERILIESDYPHADSTLARHAEGRRAQTSRSYRPRTPRGSPTSMPRSCSATRCPTAAWMASV